MLLDFFKNLFGGDDADKEEDAESEDVDKDQDADSEQNSDTEDPDASTLDDADTDDGSVDGRNHRHGRYRFARRRTSLPFQ